MATAPRSFCVRCGASAPDWGLYRGLCERCLPERVPGATHPPVLRGRRCPRCDSVTTGGRATSKTLEEAFRGGFRPAPGLKNVKIDLSAEAGADPWSGTVRYVLTGFLDSVAFRQEGAAPYRLKPEVCESCSRRAGRYYEGVVQVRATGRGLTREERTRALEEADRFDIARVAEEGGGLDLYLESGRETERLARRLAEILVGSTSASPKVAGRRDGREIYRVARVVRLRPFRPGDVVRQGGALLRVDGWKGSLLVATELPSGRRRTLRLRRNSAPPSDVRTLHGELPVLAGRGTLRVQVVSSSPSEIQVLDPESLRTVTLPRPPFLKEADGEANAVRVAGELVLVPTPRGRRGEG